ncbi:hypothetical protein Pst134EA_014961 [Puccinia striiformis f. sp. tritici]|uniref:hypothetical protein n=1 Tax=Puccinia striiformis f. sp. tritici TaxID=168172 RepID=UPI002008CF11|nr:hypothetical protein Pst134EA_014961 [Puccinia striiformis f. sp. tritici]KAH9462870.1 hypothetical protein Pst134EA_014961 [Puccinia striiformis f. sp. tritici]
MFFFIISFLCPSFPPFPPFYFLLLLLAGDTEGESELKSRVTCRENKKKIEMLILFVCLCVKSEENQFTLVCIFIMYGISSSIYLLSHRFLYDFFGPFKTK